MYCFVLRNVEPIILSRQNELQNQYLFNGKAINAINYNKCSNLCAVSMVCFKAIVQVIKRISCKVYDVLIDICGCLWMRIITNQCSIHFQIFKSSSGVRTIILQSFRATRIDEMTRIYSRTKWFYVHVNILNKCKFLSQIMRFIPWYAHLIK